MKGGDLRRVRAACAAVLAVASLASLADAADSRLRVVEYDPHRVVELTAFVGYHVNVQFAPDERFVSLGSGDTAAIDVGAEGNHLLLKPRVQVADTNLTVITNRRTYYFDYHAVARRPRPDEATYAIEFAYAPANVAAGPGDDAGDGAAARLDKAPPVRNTDYWYCGSPTLQPHSAADDGIQLRLTFGADVKFPAIYELSGDGTESLVNTHVEQDAIYIHHLAPRFILRRGSEVGCVVNRTASADTRRPAAGTVDDRTARSIRRDAR